MQNSFRPADFGLGISGFFRISNFALRVSGLVQSFVAAFLLFAMAMRVNDQQDENDKTNADQHDEDRAILPKQGDKGAKI
jgi:hypothetical protein